MKKEGEEHDRNQTDTNRLRLMHGQVVTNWIKQVSADSILIVDDKLAADKFFGTGIPDGGASGSKGGNTSD